MTDHRTGTREEWLAARRELLEAEKRHTARWTEKPRYRSSVAEASPVWIPIRTRTSAPSGHR